MNFRCTFIGHQWVTYVTGWVNTFSSIERQWCPRCGADSIIFEGHRQSVEPGVWANKTDEEREASFARTREAAAFLEARR